MSVTSPESQVERILAGKEDDHGGVIVEMTKEPLEASLFLSMLHASISHWKHQAGFYFHHAEPNYLMLVHWIPVTANTIPANASHRVGISAFVMNDNNEVLVVQEKSGRFRGTGVWKFPTGVVDQGEDISDAAVREVKEETGIDAKFVEVLAFRQSHKSFFDKSDLFFVCMLQPLSFGIQPQEAEIEAAQWMPFEEYLAQPIVQKHQLFKYISEVCSAKTAGQYNGFIPVPVGADSSGQETYLYLNTQNPNEK